MDLVEDNRLGWIRRHGYRCRSRDFPGGVRVGHRERKALGKWSAYHYVELNFVQRMMDGNMHAGEVTGLLVDCRHGAGRGAMVLSLG